MIIKKDKGKIRRARHQRQRNKIKGTQSRPRLNVFRSSKHMYAQLIDDVAGQTIASASTLDTEISSKLEGKTRKEAAKMVGELAGKRAIEKGIKEVVYDRGGFLYTGRVAELANGAREAGLKF